MLFGRDMPGTDLPYAPSWTSLYHRTKFTSTPNFIWAWLHAHQLVATPAVLADLFASDVLDESESALHGRQRGRASGAHSTHALGAPSAFRHNLSTSTKLLS